MCVCVCVCLCVHCRVLVCPPTCEFPQHLHLQGGVSSEQQMLRPQAGQQRHHRGESPQFHEMGQEVLVS